VAGGNELSDAEMLCAFSYMMQLMRLREVEWLLRFQNGCENAGRADADAFANAKFIFWSIKFNISC